MVTITTSTCGLAAHVPLTEAEAEAWLPRTCFTQGPPGRLGLELELLPVPARRSPTSGVREEGGASGEPAVRAETGGLPDLHQALTGLPLAGALTFEPGGQVELSSRPAPDLEAVRREVAADLRLIHRRAAGLGWRLTGIGLDPVPTTPTRLLDLPRYAAMEAYLDAWGHFGASGPVGRLMMCATASVQVNVEAATSAPAVTTTGNGLPVVRDRWDLVHAVAPALVAAFANSPILAGRRTGWKSTRQAVWLALDPARTRAPLTRPGEGLAEAWSRWCLDAPVMLVRRPQGPWTAPRGLTFRQWIRTGRRAVPDRRPPDLDDLGYHLTTLFPPVRARGHLEIRYLDAQPGPWWIVPAAVLTALLEDPKAGDQARDACAGVQDRWRNAALGGLDDAELARAALRVFELATVSLSGRSGTTAAARVVEAFAERWTVRRRCPGDDLVGDGVPGSGVPGADALEDDAVPRAAADQEEGIA